MIELYRTILKPVSSFSILTCSCHFNSPIEPTENKVQESKELVCTQYSNSVQYTVYSVNTYTVTVITSSPQRIETFSREGESRTWFSAVIRLSSRKRASRFKLFGATKLRLRDKRPFQPSGASDEVNHPHAAVYSAVHRRFLNTCTTRTGMRHWTAVGDSLSTASFRC